MPITFCENCESTECRCEGGAVEIAAKPTQASVGEELRVVAVVQVNDREALVLNRPLNFVYEREGMSYIGKDGPFRDLLAYSRGSGRFVAFAGRTISVRMTDGSVVDLKDHWWNGNLKGTVSATYGDVESLKKCYVFSGGACIAPKDFAALRSTYTGCVYPYWDYEKVIKFDDLRSSLWKRVFHEEGRRRALTAEVKRKHRQLVAARNCGFARATTVPNEAKP